MEETASRYNTMTDLLSKSRGVILIIGRYVPVYTKY
jgi:hypothetical protein